jgi:DNA-directed RNA polymerase specialized sigma subunit
MTCKRSSPSERKVAAPAKEVGDLTRSAETDPLIPTQPSQRLTEAIRSLSEAKRLIVTFYYYGGLTTEEITFLLSRTEYRVHQDSCLCRFFIAHSGRGSDANS